MRPLLNWTVVIAASGLGPSAIAQPTLWTGDVDGNGAIDVSDGFATMQAVLGRVTLSPEAWLRADVNHDGRLTRADAQALLDATSSSPVRPPFDPVPPGFPEIHRLDPAHGEPGDLVFIEGVNFSPQPGRNRVSWNGVVVRAWLSSDSGLIVPVPQAATSGPVTVTVSGLRSLGRGFVVGGPPASPPGLDLEEGATLFGLPREWPVRDDLVTVPLVVNEGDHRLGSYNLWLDFDHNVLFMRDVARGSSPFVVPTQCIDNLSGTASLSALRSDPGSGPGPAQRAIPFGPPGGSPRSAVSSLRHVGTLRFRAIQDADRQPFVGGIVHQMASFEFPPSRIGDSLPRFAGTTVAEEPGRFPQPPLWPWAPRIHRLIPRSGSPGDLVILRGANLGEWPQRDRVTVNGVSATVIQGNPEEIWFRVPEGATSGPVVVDVRGRGRTNALPLAVLPDEIAPEVFATSPENGAQDVDPATLVRLTFTEVLDGGTIDERSLQVLVPWYWNLDRDRANQHGLRPVPGSMRVTTLGEGVSEIVFEPIFPFPPGTDVAVVVRRRVTDLAGNPVVAPFITEFRIAGR